MIPLFSIQQIKEADSFAINQLRIPSITLMENASRSIFESILEKLQLDKNSLIGFVCGKGNNGGDGFAAARHFVNNGFCVRVIYLGEPGEMTEDARTNFFILQNLLIENRKSSLIGFNSIKEIKSLNKCNLIFDALLGTGTKGNLKSPYSEIVTELNKINAKKIAIDIPTGLDADTGYGDVVFNADYTVSLAELKRGLFVNLGAVHSGEVDKGYIGIPESYFDSLSIKEYLIEPEDVINSLPVKKKNIHKYSAGKVVVLCGSANTPGAAFLAANSVLKAGAGAAYLVFPKSLKTVAQKKVIEVIVETYDDAKQGILRTQNVDEIKKRLEWTDVIAIGSGMGRDSETMDAILQTITKYRNKKIVLDADAIYALGNGNYKNFNLKNFVLTPHYGEFANLIGISTDDLNRNVLEYGKSFAKEKSCFLVLKGAPTIIFNPSGEALINTTGNAGMAKFGTGDVLTGVLAGFLAQTDDIEKAVICGVYLHSLSADLLQKTKSEYGITASMISDNLPNSIQFLRSSFA